MKWIVDGYNVIFSDSALSKVARNNIEAARDAIVSEIESCRRLTKDKLDLVFDGKHKTAVDRLSDNLTVSFSASGQTADDLIKDEIGRSTARRSLCIVTNDYAIIDYARGCGAIVMQSEEFLSLVRKFKSAHGGSRKLETEPTLDLDAEKPRVIGKVDQELLKLFKENKK
ncbi:MAG: NYN domain-containing protein [Candidatus Kryptoniota bacterium]